MCHVFALVGLLAGSLVLGPALGTAAQEAVSTPDGRDAASPDASPSPGITQHTILFRQRIDEIPEGAGWTGVEGVTFAPGETWRQGMARGEGFGPMLYRLEAGTMTVRAAAPFTLTRAGASVANEALKETDIVLEPGDVVFMPFGVTSEWRNDGTAPARLMDAGIAFTGSPSKLADYWYDVYLTPPPAPVELTLRRLTLQPGEHLPIAAEPGLAYLGVETGRLTIVWVDRATLAPASEEHQVGTPGMPGGRPLTDLRLNLASRVVQELRNDSAAPVTFFELTITPVGEAATR